MTEQNFKMDDNWLVFDPEPSTPTYVPPAGAVDAHCHVFGPASQFPYSEKRKYTPCDASVKKLFELRNHLGFERNVIVQASCHGTDNRALLHALDQSDNMARGVVSVDPDISDSELKLMDAAGVRGVRFNFVKRLVDTMPKEALMSIAERINLLGWHIVIYFEAADLPELYDFFSSLPTPVVIDHMGRPDVAQGVDSESFALFLRLMQENENFWCKVSCPDRLSVSGPPNYADVMPFSRKIIEAFPERVLWGTDWPHPNLKSHMPDDGKLVDLIPTIAVTASLQKKLLVDNPMRLYWQEQ